MMPVLSDYLPPRKPTQHEATCVGARASLLGVAAPDLTLLLGNGLHDLVPLLGAEAQEVVATRRGVLVHVEDDVALRSYIDADALVIGLALPGALDGVAI
jgi:hypothetical protein